MWYLILTFIIVILLFKNYKKPDDNGVLEDENDSLKKQIQSLKADLFRMENSIHIQISNAEDSISEKYKKRELEFTSIINEKGFNFWGYSHQRDPDLDSIVEFLNNYINRYPYDFNHKNNHRIVDLLEEEFTMIRDREIFGLIIGQNPSNNFIKKEGLYKLHVYSLQLRFQFIVELIDKGLSKNDAFSFWNDFVREMEDSQKIKISKDFINIKIKILEILFTNSI